MIHLQRQRKKLKDGAANKRESSRRRAELDVKSDEKLTEVLIS